jgi:hypothetical protein
MARNERSLRFRLVMPVTRVGFGPFSVDPVEQLLGSSAAELLESIMDGDVSHQTRAGRVVAVYPLAIPDGEGVFLPLGSYGTIGFKNDGGLLALTMPWAMARWLARQADRIVVEGPNSVEDADAAELVVRLSRGAALGIPLGALGSVRLEAA